MRRSVALLLVALPITAHAALVHLKLVRSEPAANTAMAAPPADVKLWFSQATALAATKVSLVRPDGQVTPLAPLTRAARPDAPVVAVVPTGVTPGRWIIRWRTVAADGHVVKGDIPFTIASPATR